MSDTTFSEKLRKAAATMRKVGVGMSKALEAELPQQEISRDTSFHDLPISIKGAFFDGEEWTHHFDSACFIFGDTSVSLFVTGAHEEPDLECFYRISAEQWDAMVAFVNDRRAIVAGGPTKEWFEMAKNVTCARCGHLLDVHKLDEARYWTRSAISCPQCGFRVELPSPLNNAP